MLAAALRRLAANTQTATRDGRPYVFSVPSIRPYPFQWFWDSCFHSIVWTHADWKRAAAELGGLLDWQDEEGMIPHVVFWNQARVSPFSWHFLESQHGGGLPFAKKPAHTAGIQPPVIAQTVERIADAGGGDAYLEEVLPSLERYFRYLADRRDPDRDGLISIISQFESGLDHSPAYDEMLNIRHGNAGSMFVRPRWAQFKNKLVDYELDRIFTRYTHHQEDVVVNAIYGHGLRVLSRLARRCGRDCVATWATERADSVTAALLEHSYCERRRLFFNLQGPGHHRPSVKTIHCLMPLILPDLPRHVADALVEHLADPREFWTTYPVPSVARDEPTFSANHRLWRTRFIWRGPTSMNTNWYIVQGLRQHGYDDLAEQIVVRSHELVEHGGFNEFFNPLSGAPVGAPEFGWATLAADL